MDAAPLTLFGYWRSSAAYRVRLALAWKGLAWDSVPIDLRTGAQSTPDFLSVNPQGLVPALVIDGQVLGQSLAIIEYLDERFPQPPLLPADPLGRALVRQAALIVAADIHPINNLRVLRYLRAPLGHDQETIDSWGRHWIVNGLAGLEAFATRHGGTCLYGDDPSIADLCLVPQLYNARRIGTDLSPFPRLLSVESGLLARQFVNEARPDRQSDAN